MTETQPKANQELDLNSNQKTETKQEVVKELKMPSLRPKESNHYSSVWFEKSYAELKTSKKDTEYYELNIETYSIIIGKKAFIGNSKDETKVGFHIQNSREYPIKGTSLMITGKELIQYNIQLNMFNKQNKKTK